MFRKTINRYGRAMRAFSQKYGFYAALVTLIALFSLSAVLMRASGGNATNASRLPVAESSAPPAGEPVAARTIPMPCAGEIVCAFDAETPVWFGAVSLYQVHAGVDIRAEAGENAYSCQDGTVTGVYKSPLYGLTVEIDHGDGKTGAYGALLTNFVRAGDAVRAGQAIGQAGGPAPAEADRETHLHFEWRENGIGVQPPFANLPAQ